MTEHKFAYRSTSAISYVQSWGDYILVFPNMEFVDMLHRQTGDLIDITKTKCLCCPGCHVVTTSKYLYFFGEDHRIVRLDRELKEEEVFLEYYESIIDFSHDSLKWQM